MTKIFLYLIITLPVSLFLVSCGQKISTQNNIVTLRFATWASEDEAPQERKIFDAFEKTHPNIKIKVVYSPYNNFSEKVLTLTVGGIPPDVMWLRDLPTYASRNIIRDITDLVYHDPSIDTSKYFPHALEKCSYRGRLYAMPRDVCCSFYAYNRKMFDEAHLPYPSENWTWDDFLYDCKKLTKIKNGRVVRFGTSWFSFNDVASQNGGAQLSPDGKECWITKPEFYEGIQWWEDLALKYHVAPKGSELGGIGGDLFQNQICATAVTGPWMFAAYHKNLKFPYDIVNFPKGKAGKKTALLCLPIAISTKTPYSKEAYELLKFLTYSEEAQSLQAKLGLATPSRKDLAMSDTYKKLEIMPPHVDLYLKSLLEQTYVMGAYTYSLSVEDQVNAALEIAGLGTVSVQQAMELKKPLIDKIIRKAVIRDQRLEHS